LNKRRILYKAIAILLIIASLGGLASCTPQLKPSPEASNEDEEKEPPKELEELKKSIEDIEKALMSMHEEKKRARNNIITVRRRTGTAGTAARTRRATGTAKPTARSAAGKHGSGADSDTDEAGRTCRISKTTGKG